MKPAVKQLSLNDFFGAAKRKKEDQPNHEPTKKQKTEIESIEVFIYLLVAAITL